MNPMNGTPEGNLSPEAMIGGYSSELLNSDNPKQQQDETPLKSIIVMSS